MLIKVRIIVASDVCGDLILYDIPKHNPFRELIPLTLNAPASSPPSNHNRKLSIAHVERLPNNLGLGELVRDSATRILQ